MKFFPFIFLFLIFPSISFAQAIPLTNLSLRLVTHTDEESGNVMGTKTIRVEKTEKNIKISWYSLVREFIDDPQFPTYKVKTQRGLIETSSIEGKDAFFPPSLWGSGYTRSETALPLWVNPALVEGDSKQKTSFNAGLLNTNHDLLKLAPDQVYDDLNYFQNLYDQYVTGLQVHNIVGLKKSDEKEIRNFMRDYFLVKTIAKTKATLYVNGKKEIYPALIIGNDYLNMVVIEDPLNPLVVSYKIFPDEAPDVFKKIFKKLKKSFEFQITQVNY